MNEHQTPGDRVAAAAVALLLFGIMAGLLIVARRSAHHRRGRILTMLDLTDLVPSLLPHLPAVAFVVGVLVGLTLAAVVAFVRRRAALNVKPSPILSTRRVLTGEELARLQQAWGLHHFGQER